MINSRRCRRLFSYTRLKMKQQSELLTREQCAAFKGLAILMVMCHNFSHLIKKKVALPNENEFGYSIINGRRLIKWLIAGDVDYTLPLWFSAITGGVFMFVFLSGFGMTRKYECSGKPIPGPGRFIWQHYIKMFKLMIIPFLLTLAVFHFTDSAIFMRTKVLSWQWIMYFVGQLTFTINLMPKPHISITPGPYWYMGMIMEVWIIYRLFLYHRSGRNTWRTAWPVLVFMALGIVVSAVLFNPSYARHNFFIATLNFGCGVLAARHDWSNINFKRWQLWCIALLFLVLYYVSYFSFTLWLFSTMFTTIAAIAFIKLMPRWLLATFKWVGGVSAALYVMHPMFRYVFLRKVPVWGDYTCLFLYLAVAFALALAYNPLLKRLNRR